MPEQPDEKTLKQVYLLMLEKLKASTPNIDKELNYYRNLNYKNWKDRDFFSTLSQTVFSAGLGWDIVKGKWPEITKAFSNFDIKKVAKYGNREIKELMSNPKIIRYEPKIGAVIENAKEMQKIINGYGSFVKYISSFKNPSDLIEDLKKFKWIGETNVLEFMKEMGFPYIKDDVQVRRVFYRLGLTPENASQEEILKIGKEMAQTVNERPCVVDCVLWTFGREVCTKRKPKCDGCKLAFCRFRSTTVSCLSKR